jgi:hypothetical protein
VRVLARDVPFVDAPDLRRFAFVVARNLWIDECRRLKRLNSLEAVDPAAFAASTELARVEDRHLLSTVAVRIRELSARDQDAIVCRKVDDPTLANRAAVARFRARGRLRKLVGPIVVVVGGCRARLRRGAQPAVSASVALLPAAALLAVYSLAPVLPGATTFEEPTRPLAVPTLQPPEPVRKPTAARVVHTPVPRVAATAALEQVMRLEAPARTFVELGTRDPGADEPLLCTEGDVIPARCVALPKLPPGPR